MGRVLVTGSAGLVGRAVVRQLESDGHEVREYDLLGGDDVGDSVALGHATEECEVVVHAAAIPHDSLGTSAQIMSTNVDGTRNVLDAAERAGVRRVVVFSSAQVFGFAEGQGIPSYLPVDDEHPRLTRRPYGLSKVLAEDLCEEWTGRTGIPTVVLRPVFVVDDVALASMSSNDFDLGGFVHVADLARAASAATYAPLDGHVRMTISAAGAYDTSRARRLLAWVPERRVL